MTEGTHPLVSIIVPVYNVERYLGECLDSILGQTYDRLEVIVVEDCSTDGSLAALQPHLSDPRVRLIRHGKNSGLSAARNTGIEAATGDFVMFVDSDDMVAPGLVEACVASAMATDADVLVYDCVAFQDGGELPVLESSAKSRNPAPMKRSEYFHLPHFAWLKFVRGPLLADKALRFPVGYCYEDWPFHWALGFRAGRIFRLDGSWLAYRQRGASITGSNGRKLLDQFAVQKMVLAALRSEGEPGEGRVLADKIYMGFWSVLLRIDSRLLAEAVNEARMLREAVRVEKFYPSSGLRRMLMDLILGSPSPVAIVGIKLLRASRASRVVHGLRGTVSEAGATR